MRNNRGKGLDLPAGGSPISDIEIAEPEEFEVLRLKVSGMTCEGCASAVKRAIFRVSPAATVEVDLAAGEVRIEGSVASEAATSAIAAAGFAVEGQS
jgi:copper chaperone